MAKKRDIVEEIIKEADRLVIKKGIRPVVVVMGNKDYNAMRKSFEDGGFSYKNDKAKPGVECISVGSYKFFIARIDKPNYLKVYGD